MRILLILLLVQPIYSFAQLPHKVLICGVCKDVAQRLPFTLRIMEKIGELFSDYRIIVYENNSSDSTPILLHRWKTNNKRVTALSEHVPQHVLEQAIVNRKYGKNLFLTEVIARARNIVMRHAMSDTYQGFDYIIWMDMDFKHEPDYAGFVEVFTATQEWDAVFAYGIDPHKKFWDWYALRDRECLLGPESLGDQWWHLPKRLTLNSNDAWYPVISAFGGCGIYKKSSVKDCWYSGLVTKDLALLTENILKQSSDTIVKKYVDSLTSLTLMRLPQPSPSLPDIKNPHVGCIMPHIHSQLVWRLNSDAYKYPSVCEHVPFHASMIVHGHDKLFINPRLIFRYSAD